EAHESQVPLIAITADRPPELRGRGAGQTIDQIKLYGDSVRWFCEVGVHEADDAGLLHFRSTGARAVAESLAPPAGPGHLNVPLREPLAPDEVEDDVPAENDLAKYGRTDRRPLTRVPRSTQVPDAGLVSEFADLITSHPRGLVLAGRQRSPDLAA